jgi:uncharacterized protein YndB with AHSA1/START domain
VPQTEQKKRGVMRRRHVDLTATTTAPRPAVYRLVTDGSTWSRWAAIDSLELNRPGDPPPEGVGAIRVLRRGRTTGRDLIVELVSDRRLRYESLSGLPPRDYVGTVELEDAPDGGTTIHWRSSFAPKIPGTGAILERGIRGFLRECANGLARYAAESADRSGGDAAAQTSKTT